MAIWTVCTKAYQSCGGCGRSIAIDEPIKLLTSRELVRCQQCGGLVNEDEISLAREQHAQRRAPVDHSDRGHGFATFSDLKLPFDPKKAAAGDRE